MVRRCQLLVSFDVPLQGLAKQNMVCRTSHFESQKNGTALKPCCERKQTETQTAKVSETSAQKARGQDS
eukprot:2440233-Amphidinium_carterae.1